MIKKLLSFFVTIMNFYYCHQTCNDFNDLGIWYEIYCSLARALLPALPVSRLPACSHRGAFCTLSALHLLPQHLTSDVTLRWKTSPPHIISVSLPFLVRLRTGAITFLGFGIAIALRFCFPFVAFLFLHLTITATILGLQELLQFLLQSCRKVSLGNTKSSTELYGAGVASLPDFVIVVRVQHGIHNCHQRNCKSQCLAKVLYAKRLVKSDVFLQLVEYTISRKLTCEFHALKRFENYRKSTMLKYKMVLDLSLDFLKLLGFAAAATVIKAAGSPMQLLEHREPATA